MTQVLKVCYAQFVMSMERYHKPEVLGSLGLGKGHVFAKKKPRLC